MKDPGALRHQVRIQQRSPVQDGAGEQSGDWVEFATRRAAVDRKPGGEVFASGQRQGRTPTTFTLRWLAGVLPQMRLLHEGKVYNIDSADDPNGTRAELVITATELVEETA